MLIRFTVENFLSFKERIDFNLIASPDTRFKHHVVKNNDNKEDIALLRTSIIYGANASGKSNLIYAIDFARDLIVDGIEKNKNIPVKKFKLDNACLNKPTRIEFEFKCQNKQYAYGFVVNETTVVEEWLFEIGLTTEIAIFERQGQSINFNFAADLLKDISEAEKNRLHYEAKSTRSNLLFLTNTKERELDYFNSIYDWFYTGLVIIFPKSKPALLHILSSDKKDVFSNKLCELLAFFDFDIQKVETNDIELAESNVIPDSIILKINEDFPHDDEGYILFLPQFNIVIFKKEGKLFSRELSLLKKDNAGNNIPFEIKEESDGTRRVIDLIPMLSQLSDRACVFIVDEIENSLHSLLINKIFEYVLNNSAMRGKSSQLIATTHDVLLLDISNLFRKDEIWFVEKNKQGASKFYSLANADIDDLDLVKGYLKGRFGAIPLFKNVVSEDDNVKDSQRRL